MLSWFTNRAQDRRTAIDFYGAIVTHARRPAFFARHDAAGAQECAKEYGVSDTPEGRTAMIITLMFPLLERLQQGGMRERRVARLVAETFVTDIDDCLREMGVGDLSVPKKVKRAAQALGERCLSYRRAASATEPIAALAKELAVTVPGLDKAKHGSDALARLVLQSLSDLRATPTERLLTGAISFPEPSHLLRGAA